MRVYETNLSIIKPFFDLIYKITDQDAMNLSILQGKQLHCVIDFGMVKDDTEFIKVARALNLLGIGIVPYEYKHKNRIFPNTKQKEFTDKSTPNIIYININIFVKSIQRVALHGMLRVIKHMYPIIYNDLYKLLRLENDFLVFRDSPLNIKTLEECNYPVDEYETESISNFLTQNPNNENIPFAFFYQMNFKNSKVELPPNQQKYLDMLLEVAGKIVMSDK